MTQGTHHTPHGNGGRSESPRPSQRGTLHLVQTPDAANKCVTSMLSASYNNMQPTTRLRPVQLSIVVSRQYQGRSPRAFHGCHRIADTSVTRQICCVFVHPHTYVAAASRISSQSSYQGAKWTRCVPTSCPPRSKATHGEGGAATQDTHYTDLPFSTSGPP